MTTETPDTTAVVSKSTEAAAQAADLSKKRLEELPRYLDPLFDQLLVQPLPPEKVSEGGIHLPDGATEAPSVGLVVEAGASCKTVARDDWVVYASFVGTKLKMGATDFLIFREEEALCVMREREVGS